MVFISDSIVKEEIFLYDFQDYKNLLEKKIEKYLVDWIFLSNFALAKGTIRVLDVKNDGAMSEWLGTGLQNRSQQFESAWHLQRWKIN